MTYTYRVKKTKEGSTVSLVEIEEPKDGEYITIFFDKDRQVYMETGEKSVTSHLLEKLAKKAENNVNNKANITQ